MKVTVIKTFLHDRLGKVKKDTEIELSEFQAKSLADMGIVKTYSTKVVVEKPVEPSVEVEVETKAKFFRKKKQTQELE
jgi:Fe2+ transport system protein FeoA